MLVVSGRHEQEKREWEERRCGSCLGKEGNEVSDKVLGEKGFKRRGWSLVKGLAILVSKN